MIMLKENDIIENGSPGFIGTIQCQYKKTYTDNAPTNVLQRILGPKLKGSSSLNVTVT